MKKRLIAIILTLALAVTMMVPGSAATNFAPEDNGIMPYAEHTGPATDYSQKTLYQIYTNASTSQGCCLNAYGWGSVTDGTNVTVWPTNTTDPLQHWFVLEYGDGSCRIASSANKECAVEYYWGQSNPNNAQLFKYNYDDNGSAVANDCALTAKSLGGQNYSYYLKYHSTLYLTVKPSGISYKNSDGTYTTYYDVRWMTTSQQPEGYRSWRRDVYTSWA